MAVLATSCLLNSLKTRKITETKKAIKAYRINDVFNVRLISASFGEARVTFEAIGSLISSSFSADDSMGKDTIWVAAGFSWGVGIGVLTIAVLVGAGEGLANVFCFAVVAAATVGLGVPNSWTTKKPSLF